MQYSRWRLWRYSLLDGRFWMAHRAGRANSRRARHRLAGRRGPSSRGWPGTAFRSNTEPCARPSSEILSCLASGSMQSRLAPGQASVLIMPGTQSPFRCSGKQAEEKPGKEARLGIIAADSPAGTPMHIVRTPPEIGCPIMHDVAVRLGRRYPNMRSAGVRPGPATSCVFLWSL
jgi:hypothetical protein